MVCRLAGVYFALTLCLAIESRAQEKAAPETATSATEAAKSATPAAEKAAAPNAKGESSSSSATTTSARSPGDKKTAASAKTSTKYKTERATFGGGLFLAC